MNAERQNQLFDAIWHEDIIAVESILASECDVNAVNRHGCTPLMTAAEMGNIAIAELLLSKGADVNLPGERGDTPLHIAVDVSIDGTIQLGGSEGDEPIEFIEMLLTRGASPFVRDVSGKSALDWAAGYKSRKVENLLKSWQQKMSVSE